MQKKKKINEQQTAKKLIMRRKSCECFLCGGVVQKVALAAVYEDDSDDSDNDDKDIYGKPLSLSIQPGY